MAKKTAKPPPAPKKPAAKKRPAKKAAAKKPAPAPKAPALTDESIGYAAGAVWGLLNERGETTLAALKKATDAPDDTTLMAVGWLAREGKLAFVSSGRSVKVSLR